MELFWKSEKIDTSDPPELNQEGINNVNSSIMSSGIETVVKNLPTNKSPGLDGSLLSSSRPLKNN
jgi:hypothetical protein